MKDDLDKIKQTVQTNLAQSLPFDVLEALSRFMI